MQQIDKFAHIQDLFKWFEKQPRIGVFETEGGCFIVECPNDTVITVGFNTDDTIDEIILKTIDRFEDFDADEEFAELWSEAFGRHNHFTPTQFLGMLNADEQVLHEIAFLLRKNQLRKKYYSLPEY